MITARKTAEGWTEYRARLDALDAATRARSHQRLDEHEELFFSVLRLGLQRWVVCVWDKSGSNPERLGYL